MTLDSADEFSGRALPPEFVVKVSHASGGVITFDSQANEGALLPEPGAPFGRFRVRPERMDEVVVRRILAGWLAQPYGAEKGEWAYSVHPPRLVVEPLLRGTGGAPIRDVKCFVFSGRCRLIRIDTPDGERKRLDHITPEGEHIRVRFGEFTGPLFPMSKSMPPLPDAMPEIVAAAETLGRSVDFVRVDFLESASGYFVGELTNYPTSGTGRFVPAAYDRLLGSYWTVHGWL